MQVQSGLLYPEPPLSMSEKLGKLHSSSAKEDEDILPFSGTGEIFLSRSPI
jgi:hypothetical protein